MVCIHIYTYIHIHCMEHCTHGYLELILGPMFSGKTSKLIEIYKQYKFCNIDVYVINHAQDVRYHETKMCTHDGKEIECIQSKTIQSVIDDHIDRITDASKPLAILINEGQFFPDLYKAVYNLVQMHHVHVYVGGLDGDFQREKFGQLLDLIPMCDKVYKLHSLCMNCKNGTKAIFSHRIDKKNNAQVQIGAQDSYVPLCRKCYVNAL